MYKLPSLEVLKRTPRNKNITMDKIIKEQGYYDVLGNWNSILTFEEYPDKLFRGRVEVIILSPYNDIYMVKYTDTYRLPGGSLEINRSPKYQVEKESEEEAGIKLGRIYNTGVSYFKFFNNKYNDCKVHWDGTYTKVYVANFKSWYYGHVKACLRDKGMYEYGRFVPFEKAVNILIPEHLQALEILK